MWATIWTAQRTAGRFVVPFTVRFVRKYAKKSVNLVCVKYFNKFFLLLSDRFFTLRFILPWLRFFTLTEVFLTLTGVFPCFFLSYKANSRLKLAKSGHGQHSSKLIVTGVVLLLFVLFYVLFTCKCVLYFCHRVTNKLQLTNILYHIIFYWSHSVYEYTLRYN
jgi:hypothetical protein